MDNFPVFDLTPVWENITKDILMGRSVLMSAPKHFGKTFFCNRLLNEVKINNTYSPVLINFKEAGKQKINYKKVWKNFSDQLPELKNEVGNKTDFKEAIVSMAASKRVLIVIKSNYHDKHLSVELINTFQEVSHRYPQVFINNLVLLVLDDLALHFHEYSLKADSSFWDMFETKTKLFQVRDASAIKNTLESNSTYKNNAKEYSEHILKISGGHHGLIYRALSLLAEAGEKQILVTPGGLRDSLFTCDIMDSLKKLLLNCEEEYFEKALNFKEKKMSGNEPGRIIEELHQSGILLRSDLIFSILCPGIISELVENIYTQRFNQPVDHPSSETREKTHSENAPPRTEIFFSYAWGKRDGLIDRLYNELNNEPGIRPVRDKEDLPYSESISSFMSRIGRGTCIVVVFSDKYLRSEFCMHELYEVYKNSNFNREKTLKKICPIQIGKLKLSDPDVMNIYFGHWEKEKNKWEKFIIERATHITPQNQESYRKIKDIFNSLGDLLELLKDINHLNIHMLSKNNYQIIKTTIKQIVTV